jgi:membrane protease YdiL (CAAX protease family)
MSGSGTALADAPGLLTQLLGELAIAFAGVGLFVPRGWRAVLERLGLTAMRPRDIAFVIAGVLGAIALNTGTEWIEHHFFTALWTQDGQITKLIAGQLSLGTSLLLGVSAGMGEEITVRGALQPRLGVWLSALVFACGHVQYSWFGMLTVGLLGALLGAIRARTNTTTVIVVHALYDLFAVFTSR